MQGAGREGGREGRRVRARRGGEEADWARGPQWRGPYWEPTRPNTFSEMSRSPPGDTSRPPCTMPNRFCLSFRLWPAMQRSIQRRVRWQASSNLGTRPGRIKQDCTHGDRGTRHRSRKAAAPPHPPPQPLHPHSPPPPTPINSPVTQLKPLISHAPHTSRRPLFYCPQRRQEPS